MIKPAIQTDTTSFTLSQFLTEIKQTIDRKFKGGGYWVRGELSDWKKNGAHYYGELIEFDELSHQSIAKIRINIWANVAHKVIPKFHHATGEELRAYPINALASPFRLSEYISITCKRSIKKVLNRIFHTQINAYSLNSR